MPRAPPRPGGPAAQLRDYLALLPSGPDAVRRLTLHRVRAAVRRAAANPSILLHGNREAELNFGPAGGTSLVRGAGLQSRRPMLYPRTPDEVLMAELLVKARESCRWDCVALGEVMLRLDPGDMRVHTAREFRVWEGGGEYNVARGLRRCFGLDTAVVTAL